MLLLKLKRLKHDIGSKLLFNIPELTLFKEDKIGLVGKNGAGKTTLLEALVKQMDLHHNKTNVFGTYSYVKQLDVESSSARMSGGEFTKLKISQAFAKNPDILFLDEPTNNLDWKNIEELERKLSRFQGAAVIVSHDRELLDATCNKIWELVDGNLNVYKGNYSDYKKQKEAELRAKQEDYQKYQNERKRLLDAQLQKRQQSKTMNKPPARMGRSEWMLYKNKAAGKQKKIERVSKNLSARLERLEENKPTKPFEHAKVKLEISLHTPIHRKNIITAKNLSKNTADKNLYDIDSFYVKNGSKTALIGSNGVGKTTLIKEIIGRSEGIELAENVKIGYYQQLFNDLAANKTILEFVQENSTLPEDVIRTILARLHFYREDVYKKIGVLSGGEQAKVVFAKLTAGDFNLLILDEPTNHLDFEALEALEDLLKQYPGTLLFISHDRRFIENIATKLLFLEDQTIKSFSGTYREWLKKVAQPGSVNKNEEELMILENQLADVIGRLSMAQPGEDLSELNEVYEALVKKKKLVMQERKST